MQIFVRNDGRIRDQGFVLFLSNNALNHDVELRLVNRRNNQQQKFVETS